MNAFVIVMNYIQIQTQQWLRIAIFNLLIVALLGGLMRYKIAYSLPFIDQRNFMNAHSHFAFAGWISQALMVLMVNYLASQSGKNVFNKYRWVFIANLLTAYGMLLSFPWQGYNSISIIFSTLSIFVSYAFAFMFWRDLRKLNFKSITHYWFSAALIFNVISSAGPFFLAYMMANHWSHPNLFLLALYYFLHFQYNGWFFFACAGLFSTYFIPAEISVRMQKWIFWLFAIACVPAYFLSALWLHISWPGYVVVVLSAIAQAAAGGLLIYWVIKKRIFFCGYFKNNKWILILSAIALCIKLLLQLISTIPSLSTYAFGFRPIVIGYLHLVLLGVITLFIIGYSRSGSLINENKVGNSGMVIFIAGIILNEVFLMFQGISYMTYTYAQSINLFLLVAAAIMFVGILLMSMGQLRKRK
jgi:hypothetical protein